MFDKEQNLLKNFGRVLEEKIEEKKEEEEEEEEEEEKDSTEVEAS